MWHTLFEALAKLKLQEAFIGFLVTIGVPVGSAIAARLIKKAREWNKLAQKELAELDVEQSLRPPALPREAGTMSSSGDPHDAPTRRFTVRGEDVDALAPRMQRTAEVDAREARRREREAQEREWEARDDLARKDELLEREHAMRLMAEERVTALQAEVDYFRKTPAGAIKRELDELYAALNGGNTTHLNLPGANHAVHVQEIDARPIADIPTPRPQRLPPRPLVPTRR